ncbi:malonyl-CoA decarboxylase domain-containing protein [Aureimonas mangrovi]|uniref:malonyl-CoA decarboxylase domain-containing protein n=1 Tax=Aureimonas mangrovi TaxID=2758041 RepID=UPI00163DDFBD|nr:malonyl-CoA decarboxylase family protein [Aureimonas mangrovi]
MRSNIAFLNDFFQSLGAGVRREPQRRKLSRRAASLRLDEALARIMRPSGEASRIAVAGEALDAFAELDSAGKLAFFHKLLDDYGADAEAIRARYGAWEDEPSHAHLADLFEAVEPQRQALLRRLNMAVGGTLQLVRMRADLLSLMREDQSLAPLDTDFAHLFASWFNRGFLVMRRIDWNTSAALLEKVVEYEAVHEIQGWGDLRRRLDPLDRRCYGFFHPATGDEPLIFVEVALCHGIPDKIAPLLEEGRAAAGKEADTAVFYSISNCQPGLRGVSFGNYLIKQVARDLAEELPVVKTFVTLSPAPDFARWLSEESDEAGRALAAELSGSNWRGDEARVAQLAPLVQSAAARYFTEARDKRGAPRDPVARFHLGNGASAHRVNWPADLAPGALKRAHGLMINYLYELDAVEERQEAFARDGRIARGPELDKALARRRQPAA